MFWSAKSLVHNRVRLPGLEAPRVAKNENNKKKEYTPFREVPKWDREHEILDFSFFFLFFFFLFSLGGFLVVSGGFHCR